VAQRERTAILAHLFFDLRIAAFGTFAGAFHADMARRMKASNMGTV
jgi:hypothetical protein